MTELPEGLAKVDTWVNDGCEVYEFYEDPEHPASSALCEFAIRTDGCVEIASGGAPGVPTLVLRFIADEADRLKREV